MNELEGARESASPPRKLLKTSPFGEVFGGHIRTVPRKRVKFEVRTFNRFGAVSI